MYIPMMGIELGTLYYKLSALAIELNSSKAIAGKQLSWCIASSYICHFSTVVDFSSEKYSGSTGHTGTPGISRASYSEDADDGTRTRNPSIIN